MPTQTIDIRSQTKATGQARCKGLRVSYWAVWGLAGARTGLTSSLGHVRLVSCDAGRRAVDGAYGT